MLKGYVILKGLKNIPKCSVPSNIILNVSEGGSMKGKLMLDWCQRVFRARGSFLCNEDSLLLLDTHASHTQESVKNKMEKRKVKQKFIPAKTTSYLQPLDVGINGPFKIALREEWNFWFEHGPKEFTPKGYRKRPSYDYILKMVSNALKKITPDIINAKWPKG